MIDLFGHDPYSVLGVATVFDIEQIPYRRIATLDDAGRGLVVVAGDGLSYEEVARLRDVQALVLNGGSCFASEAFGAIDPRTVGGAWTLALDEPAWPASVVKLARAFDKSALRLPLAPLCLTSGLTRGVVMARLDDAAPVIALRNGCVWSALDLGAAFANLVTERYLTRPRSAPTASRLKGMARRTAEVAYYAAPQALRRLVQRRWYTTLEQRLAADPARVSEYPIDATGWLVIELMKSLIRRAAGFLVRLARWPAPYGAAAVLTHDIEPRRYAYTTGLARLLDTLTTGAPPATLGLVARASARHLDEAAIGRIRRHQVICHGLAHEGENVDGRERVEADLRQARATLERKLDRRVCGYRSPRLDRSPDLAAALDRVGFRYDSSYPDVDRENIAHFGAGVRVNVPFRPLVDDAGRLRPSTCLELPLTAPDCIQPLFAGEDVAALRRTVETKARFLRATGGLYVALVHAGVFGDADAAVRGAHLAFVRQQFGHADVWLTGMAEVADWWIRREALAVSLDGGTLHVANRGSETVTGARAILDRPGGHTTIDIPPLSPGTTVALAVPKTTLLPAA